MKGMAAPHANMIRSAIAILLFAPLIIFISMASAKAQDGKQTQKNADGTKTTTEPHGNDGTMKTTENAEGKTVDIVISQPDATFGAGGTKLTLHLTETPWTSIEDNPSMWVYKDASGKVRRIEYNKDLNGEDFISYTVDYGPDGRMRSYTRQVHTGDPENFPEGLQTTTTFTYDKFGRPSIILEDFTEYTDDGEFKVKHYRTTYRYTGDADKKGTATVEVRDDAGGKWEKQPGNTPTTLESAVQNAEEIQKTVKGVTERQVSIVEDLGLSNDLELSIDRADAETAGTPTPLQPQQVQQNSSPPPFWSGMPPSGMGMEREDMKDRERRIPDDRRVPVFPR